MPLFSGTRLGPYEIVSPLGAGGMGEVYRARDPRLGREVAIKVLPASLSQDPDRLRRFEQEARAAGLLNHPNITAVYDIGTQDGSPYVVQELLEGETLRSRLAGGAFTHRKALGHALQFAHGLAAAHEKGIVHRDLKPENVFVTRDGRVKILDFGLAKLAGENSESGEQSRLPTASPETEPGMVLGTLGYMSPEQVRGRPSDARSDIFSFGAILYEMLSGRRAFRGDTAADTMSAILKEEPPSLSATQKEIPPGLERIVSHCLEKNPEERFQSARDLAFDLESLSGVTGIPVAGRSVPTRIPRRGQLGLVVAAAAALALAAILVSRGRSGGSIDSIAVLPFANGSRDPNTEYLSDGITEGVINTLSRLSHLRVIARSTAFRYKARDVDPQRAGRDLNVQAIVTGRVVQRGDTLAVQAELVDVANGTQLWGNHYDRKLSEILGLQESISKEISEKLRLRLSGDEKQKVVKLDTANTEAYQFYLKGRYAWEKRTETELARSIEYFEKAIEKDPSYALAYSGLADAYAVLPAYSILGPEEAFPRARAAARKALEIDDGLAHAHATLGVVLTDYEHDWSSAEAQYRKAIELDPNDATAHHWYGLQLIGLARSEEAVRELQRAREIDPFSAIIQVNLARAFLYARQYDRAIEETRKARGLDTSFAPTHLLAGEVYAAKGMTQEAIDEFRAAATVVGGSAFGLFSLGRAQALAGDRAGAQKTIEQLISLAGTRYVSPGSIAAIYQNLGEKNAALEWLEKACKKRTFESLFVKVNPAFDDLRGDPRFGQLLRCMNLAS